MALFQKLQRTVCKLTHPVVQKANTTELSESEEDEANCDYAVALQNCLIGLANEVYGVADPRDISGRVLRQACDFYDADWCGLFDVDRMLKLLVPFWWYNRTTGGMTKTKLDEGGVYGDFTRWMDALNTNTPIYVDDIEIIKDSNPEEYAIYSKQAVRSILAVPYHKREKGFLLLRNPKRYGDMKKYSETDYHKEQREKIQDQFSGMIYCAECGHNMYYVRYLHDYKTLKKTGGHYLCPQNGGKAACGGRVVHEDFLKIFVMDQIHLLIKGMCDRKKMLDMVNTSQGGKNALLSAQKKMLALQVKISETEERQHKLYEDYADGLLDAEDYQNIKEQYVADAQRMQDELAGLEVKRKRLEKTIDDYSKIVKHLEQYLDNREFNTELVHELVERVSISNTDGYEITFKCEDVYKRVIEMMEGGECE